MKQYWLFFRVWLCKKIMASDGIVIGCDIEATENGGIKITNPTKNVSVVGNRIIPSGEPI